MKSFKFDPKTGRFEFCLKSQIYPNDIKVLRHIVEKGYGDVEKIGELFDDAKEDQKFHIYNGSIYHLRELEMVIFRDDQNVCTHRNKKDYSKSKWEKKSGYFLTTLGKAFIHSLGFPIEK